MHLSSNVQPKITLTRQSKERYFSDEAKSFWNDWKCLPQNRHAIVTHHQTAQTFDQVLSPVLDIMFDPEMDQFLSTVASDTNINSLFIRVRD